MQELQNLLINYFCQDLGSNQIKKPVNLLQREIEMFFGTTDKVSLPREEIWILSWQRNLIFLTVLVKHSSRIGGWSGYMKEKSFYIALAMAKEHQLIIEQNLEHHAFELFLHTSSWTITVMNEILNRSVKYQEQIHSNWRGPSKSCMLEVWDGTEEARDVAAEIVEALL